MALSTINSDLRSLASSSQILFFDTKTSYKEVLQFQKLLVEKLLVDRFKAEDDPTQKRVYRLACEHPPTYTGGRSISKSKLEDIKKNFTGEVVQTERGGRVMYHGPGQLTLYFIFNLKEYFEGSRAYVEQLFKAIQSHFLDLYGLSLDCHDQGVWLKNKKVGFVGVRVKRGVVYHGLSLNYFTDLEPFLSQPPCNIKGNQVGNLFLSPLSTLFFRDEAKNLASNMPF